MLETHVAERSPTLYVTAWVLVLMFLSVLVGSAIAKTEIVARGQGRIVASGRTQSIQPQFSGQIAAIHVRDGDRVRPGDVLLTIDPTEIESEINRLSAERDRQKREFAVADTILHSLISFDPTNEQFIPKDLDLTKIGNAQLAAQTDEIVTSTLKAIQAQVLEADADAAQIRASITTQQARIARAESDFRFVAERNHAAAELEANGTISRTTYLDRIRETKATEGDLEIARDQYDELQSRLHLAQQRRMRIITESRAQYRKSVAEAKTVIAGIDAQLDAAHKRLVNTQLRAPLAGHVENLTVFTIGGFVQAGQPLMSIVPANETLEIEAFFENRDAGFLMSGQRAFIKLDAFPAERFGIITGTVLTIGADTRKVDDFPGWVYASRIAPDRNQVERDGRTYQFTPGMTGTVDVVTGERRLISYFFEPVIKAIQDGLRER